MDAAYLLAQRNRSSHVPHGMFVEGDAPDPAETWMNSKLASRLLFFWAWGLLSAPMVQWIAAGAIEDGLDNEHVRELANIGCQGLYKGNMRRDLLRLCMRRRKLSPLTSVRVNMRKVLNGLVDVLDQAIINPLELLDTSMQHWPKYLVHKNKQRLTTSGHT